VSAAKVHNNGKSKILEELPKNGILIVVGIVTIVTILKISQDDPLHMVELSGVFELP
jgi:hypothetical protein